MYGREQIQEGLGEGLMQRHDAVMHFMKTGGVSGRPIGGIDDVSDRTNYFREEYAYGDEVYLPGIEDFMWADSLMQGARELYGTEIVEPSIVYANILLPGQELAMHTDVPEFRGINRKSSPEWLMVVMHHSGLFEDWRIHIATGVSYFHDCDGGEFVYYPDGRNGDRRTLPVRHNTGILLDTDTVFHGVDRVDDAGLPPRPRLTPGASIEFDPASNEWRVFDERDREVTSYGWGQIRFSVSWKAYCFTDEHERRAVHQNTDDLDRTVVLDTLFHDLRQRGRIDERPEDGTDTALLLIEEYVTFPS
jgi:hypothetical protein